MCCAAVNWWRRNPGGRRRSFSECCIALLTEALMLSPEQSQLASLFTPALRLKSYKTGGFEYSAHTRRIGPTVADPRTIVVNLDDTLNNFTETLQHGEFPYNPADSLSEATFEHHLRKIRSGDSEPGDLFSTEYSYCRFKIHLQCWQRARARPDGVEFMQWLTRNQWRIVICVPRDLRRAHDCTRAWLQENDIPFDYLFMASDKIVFCKAWGIRHLVDRAMV